ncbi:hypothetical protein H4582DRAFT_1916788 [Lactarius indigo]|nr:hypothetical protein H4582DRAFT_1916788 [Lactarius indigo]
MHRSSHLSLDSGGGGIFLERHDQLNTHKPHPLPHCRVLLLQPRRPIRVRALLPACPLMVLVPVGTPTLLRALLSLTSLPLNPCAESAPLRTHTVIPQTAGRRFVEQLETVGFGRREAVLPVVQAFAGIATSHRESPRSGTRRTTIVKGARECGALEKARKVTR